RVPHLLAKQGAVVQPGRRPAQARQVPARHEGAWWTNRPARRFVDGGWREGLTGARLRFGAEIALQPLLDLTARRRADLLSDWLAAFEQQHGRDSAHSVAARDVGIFVDVELRDRHLVAKLAGNLLERRCNHPARPAP